jgi:6-phosphogluconolactonase (cycloisomerase 2 family)
MKYRPMMHPCALGAAALAALFLSGCGAGNSNNPNATHTTTNPMPPTTPTVSQIVYVADAGTTSVKAFTISGTLSNPAVAALGSPVATSSNLHTTAIDPSHRFLFVLTQPDDNELSVYSINSDGSLGALVTSNFFGNSVSGSKQELVVAAPAGAPTGTEYVYIASGTIGTLTGFQFNSGTSALTGFTPGVSSTDTPYSFATDSTGTHLYSGDISSSGRPVVTPYTINPANGDLTALTPVASGDDGPVLVANDSVGSSLYGFDAGAQLLYAYTKNSDGSPTPGNYLSTHATGNDLVVAPSGTAVFLSNGTAGTLSEATTQSNGNLNTPTTTTAISGGNLIGVAVDATSAFVGTVDSAHNNLVVFPLSGTTLGSPLTFPLGTSNPVAVVFVSQSTDYANAKKK